MAWETGDFVAFGGLVGGALLGLTLAFQGSPSAAYRAAAVVAIAAAFLLTWANGAVGVIGNSTNDANLMYPVLLALAIAGSWLVRGRPRAMARLLRAMAAGQVLVGVVARAGGLGAGGSAWPMDILVATVIFTFLWLTSGWLFSRAAAQGASGPAHPPRRK